MRLVDAHVHIFETLKGFSGKGELCAIGGGKGRWANGDTVDMIPKGAGDRNFTIESCRNVLKAGGIEKAVLLQGSFYGFDNEYVHTAQEQYPETFVAAGTFDPFARFVDSIYDRLTNELGFKILKFETSSGMGFMSYHHDFDIEKVFTPYAEKARLHKQILVFDIGRPEQSSAQPDKIYALAKKFSDVQFVVCHLFAPSIRDKDKVRSNLKLLALDNVAFDLAALPKNMKPEAYPYPTAAEYVRMACDIAGYDKIMWGTDAPSNLCDETYHHLWDYLEVSGKFSDTELEAIVGGNALRVYPFK